MKEPIVDSEDPELEYNLYDYSYLQYRGNLFTGTLIYSDTNPISFAEYHEGNYHGHQVSYHRNGQIHEDVMMENGRYLSGKEWYDNGQLRYDSSDTYVYWDADGLMSKKGDIWFYKNGNPRSKKDINGTAILSSDGRIAIHSIALSGGQGRCTRETTFYAEVIKYCLTELYADIYLHPEDNDCLRNSIDHNIQHYIRSLYYKGHKDQAIAIINQIIADAERRQNEKKDILGQGHSENTLLHNSKIKKKHLETDRMDLYGLVGLEDCTKIVFDLSK